MEQGKVTPHNLEMEESILGAVIVEAKCLDRIIDFFTPDLFYNNNQQSICNAILSLKKRSEKIDLLTVVNELKSMKELENVGGAYYVSILSNRIASTAHIEAWTRYILDLSVRRKMIYHYGTLYHKAFDLSHNVDDLTTENDIFLSSVTREESDNIITSRDLAIETRKQIDAQSLKNGITGVPSGFKDIDSVIGGWQNQDLIILGARPGMGKTALILQIIKHPAIVHKIPVAIFSIEMGRNPIYMRMMAQESGIELNRISGKSITKLNQYEKDSMDKSCNPLYEAPIYFEDTGSITLRSFCSKVRRLVNKNGVKLVAADYLQLMRGSGKTFNREQEVSEISRTIKSLAKELDIPIILISSLSRALETRSATNKAPILSDLRESGNIESDADIILFLYRPEYYAIPEFEAPSGMISSAGKAILDIAKHRNGSTGAVLLNWEASKTRFSDYSTHTFEEALPGQQPNQNFETEAPY